MRAFAVAIQVALIRLHHRLRSDDRGQTTAEYVLLMLGAATIALLVVAWATKTGKVSGLLDRVLNSITSKVS